jgi:hypothetical protein
MAFLTVGCLSGYSLAYRSSNLSADQAHELKISKSDKTVRMPTMDFENRFRIVNPPFKLDVWWTVGRFKSGQFPNLTG